MRRHAQRLNIRRAQFINAVVPQLEPYRRLNPVTDNHLTHAHQRHIAAAARVSVKDRTPFQALLTFPLKIS
jgi:hypothetical protein